MTSLLKSSGEGTCFDAFFSSCKRIHQKQIMYLDIDSKGNRSIPHKEEVYRNVIDQLETLNINELVNSDKLQLSIKSAAENTGFEQIVDFLQLITEIEEINKPLFLPELEKRKTYILNKIESALEVLSTLNLFDEKHTNSHPLSGKNILLVEDMAYNRLILNKVLSKYNVHLKEVENGQLALDEWNGDKNFDLILMDMNMPVMDGFTATKAIREIESKQKLNRVPIIALTALAMRGDKEKCLEAGCDGYLSKPIDSTSFISLCSELLMDDSNFEKKDSKLNSIKLDRVLLKTANHVYQAALTRSLLAFGIETEIVSTEDEFLKIISLEEFDLIILDPDFDLQLAYYVKKLYPLQIVTFILSDDYRGELLYEDELENLKFPFKSKELQKILDACSIKIQSSKKTQEELKDVLSLESVKSQYQLKETILKSDHQLAVWQKSFRKIGGDLILSHQFNYHGRFGLVLADVAGHDIKSGYTASWFSGLVKGVWEQNSNPIDLLMYLNKLFDHDTEEEDKRFVCALALLWDRMRNQLFYANAGIPGGLIVRNGSSNSEQINWKGLPIGLFSDVEMFDHGMVDFYPGDRLYIATDGVLESIPNEVFQDISNNQSDQPVKEALDSIVDFISRSIEITDDLTIAAFEAKTMPAIKNGFRASILSTFEDVDQLIKKTEKFINLNQKIKFDWALVSIALREALINSVEHGNKEQSHAPIDLDVVIENETLILIVSDTGCGFDVASTKSQLEAEGSLRIHGRGLEMIENITRSVCYHGGGIKMEFAAIK